MSDDYKPQAWRFNEDGFYPDQYAQSTARLGIGIDYQDDDYNRYMREFMADLAAHDAAKRAEWEAEQAAERDFWECKEVGRKGEYVTYRRPKWSAPVGAWEQMPVEQEGAPSE